MERSSITDDPDHRPTTARADQGDALDPVVLVEVAADLVRRANAQRRAVERWAHLEAAAVRRIRAVHPAPTLAGRR